MLVQDPLDSIVQKMATVLSTVVGMDRVRMLESPALLETIPVTYSVPLKAHVVV